MTNTKSSGNQNRQSANDSEEDVAKRRAGANPDKSSNNEKTTIKAGKDKGAGGGAKQKESR